MELTEEQWCERQDKLVRLRKNPQVLRFLQVHHLDNAFLEKNASYFVSWLENLNKCKNCQGKEFCRQRIPGKVCNLCIDEFGYLSEEYVSCRYEKNEEEKIGHEKYYRICHGTRKDLMIDFFNIQLENESQAYIDVYNKIAESLESKKGIYLFGQPGTGKSYLMWAISNYYAKHEIKVSYVKVPMLIQNIKDSFQTSDSEYRQEIMAHLRFSKVLILDDIGSEKTSVWERDDILYPLLEYRMNHHLKTYFASNYTMEDLERQYRFPSEEENTQVASMRLIERVRSLATSVALLGKSRR